MEPGPGTAATGATSVYDRVVRDARQTFGHLAPDEVVVQAARDALDELMIQNDARVTAYIPVLAMRRIRETFAAAAAPESAG